MDTGRFWDEGVLQEGAGQLPCHVDCEEKGEQSGWLGTEIPEEATTTSGEKLRILLPTSLLQKKEIECSPRASCRSNRQTILLRCTRKLGLILPAAATAGPICPRRCHAGDDDFKGGAELST
jgi:hypothetical protein